MATNRALDPYAVLGIPVGAPRAAGARAHRRLAKAFHPDVNPGPAAAERMRRINEAWRILSNRARRARYDAERGLGARPRPGPAYGAGTGTTAWASWPPPQAATPRSRRPPRPAPVEPSFGDRREVVLAVGAAMTLLVFIGTWLGSVAR